MSASYSTSTISTALIETKETKSTALSNLDPRSLLTKDKSVSDHLPRKLGKDMISYNVMVQYGVADAHTGGFVENVETNGVVSYTEESTEDYEKRLLNKAAPFIKQCIDENPETNFFLVQEAPFLKEEKGNLGQAFVNAVLENLGDGWGVVKQSNQGYAKHMFYRKRYFEHDVRSTTALQTKLRGAEDDMHIGPKEYFSAVFKDKMSKQLRAITNVHLQPEEEDNENQVNFLLKQSSGFNKSGINEVCGNMNRWTGIKSDQPGLTLNYSNAHTYSIYLGEFGVRKYNSVDAGYECHGGKIIRKLDALIHPQTAKIIEQQPVSEVDSELFESSFAKQFFGNLDLEKFNTSLEQLSDQLSRSSVGIEAVEVTLQVNAYNAQRIQIKSEFPIPLLESEMQGLKKEVSDYFYYYVSLQSKEAAEIVIAHINAHEKLEMAYSKGLKIVGETMTRDASLIEKLTADAVVIREQITQLENNYKKAKAAAPALRIEQRRYQIIGMVALMDKWLVNPEKVNVSEMKSADLSKLLNAKLSLLYKINKSDESLIALRSVAGDLSRQIGYDIDYDSIYIKSLIEYAKANNIVLKKNLDYTKKVTERLKKFTAFQKNVGNEQALLLVREKSPSDHLPRKLGKDVVTYNVMTQSGVHDAETGGYVKESDSRVELLCTKETPEQYRDRMLTEVASFIKRYTENDPEISFFLLQEAPLITEEKGNLGQVFVNTTLELLGKDWGVIAQSGVGLAKHTFYRKDRYVADDKQTAELQTQTMKALEAAGKENKNSGLQLGRKEYFSAVFKSTDGGVRTVVNVHLNPGLGKSHLYEKEINFLAQQAIMLNKEGVHDVAGDINQYTGIKTDQAGFILNYSNVHTFDLQGEIGNQSYSSVDAGFEYRNGKLTRKIDKLINPETASVIEAKPLSRSDVDDRLFKNTFNELLFGNLELEEFKTTLEELDTHLKEAPGFEGNEIETQVSINAYNARVIQIRSTYPIPLLEIEHKGLTEDSDHRHFYLISLDSKEDAAALIARIHGHKDFVLTDDLTRQIVRSSMEKYEKHIKELSAKKEFFVKSFERATSVHSKANEEAFNACVELLKNEMVAKINDVNLLLKIVDDEKSIRAMKPEELFGHFVGKQTTLKSRTSKLKFATGKTGEDAAESFSIPEAEELLKSMVKFREDTFPAQLKKMYCIRKAKIELMKAKDALDYHNAKIEKLSARIAEFSELEVSVNQKSKCVIS